MNYKQLRITIIGLAISFFIPLSGIGIVRYDGPAVNDLGTKTKTIASLPIKPLKTLSLVTEWSMVNLSNPYVADIIAHESQGNIYAENSIGCLGIMQACPGSKLTNVCNLSDEICQLNWFYGYMLRTYGSWANADQHELTQGWW